MKKIPTAICALALATMGAVAHGQDAAKGMDHSGMAMPGAMGELGAAMDTMMRNMPSQSSGTVDTDFLLMMIPHHQSAIDMALIELEQGRDAETRAMAEAIIAAQESEIAQMIAMLERMGVAPPVAQ